MRPRLKSSDGPSEIVSSHTFGAGFPYQGRGRVEPRTPTEQHCRGAYAAKHGLSKVIAGSVPSGSVTANDAYDRGCLQPECRRFGADEHLRVHPRWRVGLARQPLRWLSVRSTSSRI